MTSVRLLREPKLSRIAWGVLFTALSPLLASSQDARLLYEPLPNLPDPIGVAGPVVGIHANHLIVAGGANFALPDDPKLWNLPKRYLTNAWVIPRNGKAWFKQKEAGFQLSRPIAYSAIVSTENGVYVMGGENESGPSQRAFLLQVDASQSPPRLTEIDEAIPNLPLPCTGCAAARIGNFIYLVAGQVQLADGTRQASRIVWRLDESRIDLSRDMDSQSDLWERIPAWPSDGPDRMFALVASQHDGFGDRLYVIGGRKFADGKEPSDETLEFGSDGWCFDPERYDRDVSLGNADTKDPSVYWRRIADAPVPLSAGTAVGYGPSHIIVPAYASGDRLREQLDSGKPMSEFRHPGFNRVAYGYHTITDTWVSLGKTPANQVTTPAVCWGDEIVLVSGEIRPRVRTNRVWSITPTSSTSEFGQINLVVLVVYLAGMLGIGLAFTVRNRSTDDYFRGGKSIPWWAASCSIFATMLSSITYMAVPAKAFAQDWVYAIGNFWIIGVAPIAVWIALPFFRRIDATSAYEYLELRFNRTARLISSGSFSLFHIFRMAIVLALAGLALASVTPFSAYHCVLIMGALSIVYCTLGGIEAVIWTDTIQTFILMGGAILCFGFAILGSDPGSLTAAWDSGKVQVANLDFGPQSFTTMAIWVVVLGGFGQNLASYTADQAVVQRYMTTSDEKKAGASIWLNGLLTIPSTILFFSLGTAFWMFYRSHPEKLDPTMATDRILPHFINQELPVGLAGLVVAGIFAAAQSTVSTSMNSGASTIITDFARPSKVCTSERGFLWLARFVTLAMGIAGTWLGTQFIDPDIKSLFDQFVGVLGMFLGVLAGLFALGATTRRANGPGSLIGAVVAIIVMFTIVRASKNLVLAGIDFRQMYDAVGFPLYRIQSYLYAFVGICVCYVVGFLASLLFTPKPTAQLAGLTLWDPPAENRDPA